MHRQWHQFCMAILGLATSPGKSYFSVTFDDVKEGLSMKRIAVIALCGFIAVFVAADGAVASSQRADASFNVESIQLPLSTSPAIAPGDDGDSELAGHRRRCRGHRRHRC
jgi:hypothetical protein